MRRGFLILIAAVLLSQAGCTCVERCLGRYLLANGDDRHAPYVLSDSAPLQP
jgi:hypothetical protein